MFRIKTLNQISVKGLDRFPREKYEISSDMGEPQAILLRSFDMQNMEIPESVWAVGRAGAGVNNVPVAKLTGRGVPVFNTPGANANAVKELVIAGLLLACRNILPAWDFARRLEGDDPTLNTLVEKGKSQFSGFELQGETLGVIGLGAIGVKVANAALGLGMHVVGYDPTITVRRAWELSSRVKQAESVDELLSHSRFVTVHVPLLTETKGLLNTARIQMMQTGSVILNFSREGVVDNRAILDALNHKKLYAYVTDFPVGAIKNHPQVIALPHLGASTEQAEENCAMMAVDQIRDYLEYGVIRNSVNFPEVLLQKAEGARLAIANQNIPNMVGQISTILGGAGVNILDMFNKSRGEIAYTLIDTNQDVPPAVLNKIERVEGILKVRVIYGYNPA